MPLPALRLGMGQADFSASSLRKVQNSILERPKGQVANGKTQEEEFGEEEGGKVTKTAILIGVFVVSLLGAAKPRAWQTGTIEATLEQREVAGASTQSGYGPYVRYAPQVATSRVAYATWLGYGIHTETMDYLIRYLLPRKIFGKPVRPNVTVHGPVKFAVEKTALYFLDEDGIEFETVIMEKRLSEKKDPK